MIARRAVLRGLGALAAAPLLTGPVRAEIALGDGASLVTVSDGHLILPPDLVFGPMPQEELAEALRPLGIAPTDRLEPACNVTLLRRGDRVVLFDAGAGPDFQPTAGHLAAALEVAGITADAVTDVIFTHAHPDHLWGVLDGFDEPTFPRARHHIGAVERAYWSDPATVQSIDPARQSFVVGAARRIEALGERISILRAGLEPVPGVEVIETFGHTPGHLSFQIEDVLILGDALSNHHVAFARPAWNSGSDQDMPTAAQTRVRLLDRIVADDLRIVGFHLPGGGIGRVEPRERGFRFVPGD